MKVAFRLAGISLLLAASSLSAATHYVSIGSANPTPPYASWDTAAGQIQQAVDAAAAGDVVLVASGGYPGGVTVTNPLALTSINGPQSTVIDAPPPWNSFGSCVYLTGGASLSGFTLQNAYNGVKGSPSTNAFVTNCVIVGNRAGKLVPVGGAYNCTLYNCTLSRNSGEVEAAGAYNCTLYNCTLTGNSVMANGSYIGGWGAGACYCTLYNCTLTGNSAQPVGGSDVGPGGGACHSTLCNCTLSGNSGVGAYDCTLFNCTLTGNSAGGAQHSTLYNCIVYFNPSSSGVNYDHYSSLTYCCTTPQNYNVGNIAADPLLDGNLRLQPNSPCINAGNNAYATNATDLDGNPRIVSGTVDIGAYEYQGTGSRISYAWLQQYGLPTDGSADFIDSDHDGMNNWQEWVCGTCPTNAQSALRMLSATTTPINATVTWESVAGVNYFLERSTNLAEPFTLLTTNIVGAGDTTSFADTSAVGAGPLFYRVGVGH